MYMLLEAILKGTLFAVLGYAVFVSDMSFSATLLLAIVVGLVGGFVSHLIDIAEEENKR